MGLNDIQLTNQQLTNLYADVLIEITIASAVPERQRVKYLGKNARNILLFVNNGDVPFLTDDELSFVTNILSACKLSLADVAIVNIHSLPENGAAEAIGLLEPKNILLFGIPPLAIDLPINFPQFQLQSFNSRMYLYSPKLQELQSDKALKLKLWNGLKTMFGL